ncbi:MAG: transposase [Hyphomonadaceae bacterium]|nr:transposase [Hyphomonadaceae bacterium]MBC6412811.1 transposase [Hyphomonadaceae bacterium]
MGDVFMLSEQQLARIEPFFPLARGVARVDDCKAISGIVHVIRNGLRRGDASLEYGPPAPCKTLYNRFKRWSERGHFGKILSRLSAEEGPKTLMIDSTHIKVHRNACSPFEKGYVSRHAAHGRLVDVGHIHCKKPSGQKAKGTAHTDPYQVRQ